MHIMLEERIVTATGVERRTSVEPVGNDRDRAFQLFTDRVAANPAAYAPTAGIRLVLVAGGAS
ncbi:hypothetical protein AB0B48_24480 [Micromonospora sp. NPDC049089]|uniref:hypothetical protein n=1 Tax=Micromonospora sp. NPDC049089 TaxID=3155496 RepID=UPI00340787C6